MNYREQRLRQLIIDSATIINNSLLIDFQKPPSNKYGQIEKEVAASIITDDVIHPNKCIEILDIVNKDRVTFHYICYIHKLCIAFLYNPQTQELFYIYTDEIDDTKRLISLLLSIGRNDTMLR